MPILSCLLRSFARWALVQSQNSKREPLLPSHRIPSHPSLLVLLHLSSLLSLPAKASELGTAPPASFAVRESDLNLVPPAPTSPHHIFPTFLTFTSHTPPDFFSCSLPLIPTSFLHHTLVSRFPLIISLKRRLSPYTITYHSDLS
ncbi:hypothetical protein LY76DRAFT_251662 [Colletotrichum caudatum]|nr:hypothetical protein LY76DRAFT_251662 [Colletotrichum caudatum]